MLASIFQLCEHASWSWNRKAVVRQLIVVVLLICNSFTFAQNVTPQNRVSIQARGPDGQVFHANIWQKAQGLPDDTVTCIYQTHDGFLWVGTMRGLARFDGVNFRRCGLGNQDDKNACEVTALCEDQCGNLWIGTDKALFIMKTAGGFPAEPKCLLNREITSIVCDQAGCLWVGTTSGLLSSQKNNFDASRFLYDTNFPDVSISQICLSPDGTLWVISPDGISQRIGGRFQKNKLRIIDQARRKPVVGIVFNKAGKSWGYGLDFLYDMTANGYSYFYFFRAGNIQTPRVWSACAENSDAKNVLWFATSGRGLLCLQNNRLLAVDITTDNQALKDLRTVFEDANGSLWVGTRGDGLIRLRQNSARFYELPDGVPMEPATTFAVDPEGKVWAGFKQGGLWSFSGVEAKKWNCSSLPDGVQNVRSLAASNQGLWIGTDGQGLLRWQNDRLKTWTLEDGLADNSINCVCSDNSEGAWLGLENGLLQHWHANNFENFPTQDASKMSPVTCLLVGSDNSLWVGRQEGGIQHLVEGRFEVLTPPNRLQDQTVTTICEDSDGRIWVGTGSDGLYVCSQGKWRPVINDEVSAQKFIHAIVSDRNGNVTIINANGCYMAVRSAIESFITKNTTLSMLPVAGMVNITIPTENFGWPAALLRPENRLWTTTTHGLASMNLTMAEITHPLPPVFIEQLMMDDSPIPLLEQYVSTNKDDNVGKNTLSLAYGFKQLEFDFNAPSLGSANEVHFRYRLKGYDDDWTPMGLGRSARIARLLPGHYEFQVADSVREGLWNNNVAILAFQVLPPFWMRWWFVLTVAATIVGSLIWMVRTISHRRLRVRLVRAEQQQATERERARIARDMHDEVGSKLTRIKILSNLAQHPRQEPDQQLQQLKAIGDTSEDAVKKFDEIVWAVNPKNDTLQHLTDYLAHYAVEYFEGTQIQCELNIPPVTSDCPLSSEVRHNFFLAYKEALCNVLHHSQATKVCIGLAFTPSSFEVCIIDDGQGFEPSLQAAKEGADGLTNMRKRLTGIGGQFKIQSKIGHGTQVRLLLITPLNTSKNDE